MDDASLRFNALPGQHGTRIVLPASAPIPLNTSSKTSASNVFSMKAGMVKNASAKRVTSKSKGSAEHVTSTPSTMAETVSVIMDGTVMLTCARSAIPLVVSVKDPNQTNVLLAQM